MFRSGFDPRRLKNNDKHVSRFTMRMHVSSTQTCWNHAYAYYVHVYAYLFIKPAYAYSRVCTHMVGPADAILCPKLNAFLSLTFVQYDSHTLVFVNFKDCLLFQVRLI